MRDLYNRENSHITCEVLTDVTTRPDLETEYGIGQVNKELIIIENEDRKKHWLQVIYTQQTIQHMTLLIQQNKRLQLQY